LKIKKAEIVNLLEDRIHELKLHSNDKTNETSVKVDFRGFEIKTVRFTVVPEKKKRRESGCSWVKV
jgi:hypothetical protein